MGTLVAFHAHPDDESIATGGVIAAAAAAGHRVVLVVGTGGEYGEKPDDLDEGETLAQRRAHEVSKSAETLGIARVEFLGYLDSGMTGWEQNSDPNSLMQADLEEAATRLADILRSENADTLTVYDWHGNYGHPDHIAVHRIGHRAAEIAGTAHVYEATMNRDHMTRMFAAQRAAAASTGEDSHVPDWNPDEGADDGNPFGMLESELTTAVDVTAFMKQKRDSIACHASQVSDSSFFMQMPPDAFSMAFGTEWFIRKGAPAGIHEHQLAGIPF